VALSRLQNAGLTDPLVLGGFATFVIALPVFVVVQLHTRSPLVDLRLFRQTSVAASNAAMFFGNMARMAVVLIGGLYFQAVNGDSTLEAAFKVLPLPLATTLAGLTMGRISRWGTQHAIATLSAAVSGAGVVVLLFGFGHGMSYPVIFVGLFVAGFGGGVFMPANTTAILREVPRERLGVVNAVRMMLLSAGGLMSTALSLALLTSTLSADLRASVFAGTVSRVAGGAVGDLRDGYTRAILVLILLNIVGVLSAYIGQRTHHGTTAAEGIPVVEPANQGATDTLSPVSPAEAAEHEDAPQDGREPDAARGPVGAP